MGVDDIEDYIDTLNVLYLTTGLLIEDGKLYKDNNVVAEIKFDNNNNKYYSKYMN